VGQLDVIFFGRDWKPTWSGSISSWLKNNSTRANIRKSTKNCFSVCVFSTLFCWNEKSSNNWVGTWFTALTIPILW